MKHVPHKCDGCVDETCPVCIGLNGCSICNTWECEVPKDCPGYALNDLQREAICKREVDFVNGRWIDIRITLN